MKRLALVASFCGIAITQMMAQNINGEILAQMGRQKMVEKRGLEDAALAYENHDRLVGDIGAHPANHHVDQPFPEGIDKILLRMAVTACLHHGYPMG